MYVILEALFALIIFFYSKSKLNVQNSFVIVERNDEASAWMELIALELAESRNVEFKNEQDTW